MQWFKKKRVTETKFKLKVADPTPQPPPVSVEPETDGGFDVPSDEGFGDEGFGDEGNSDKPFDDEPFDAGVETSEEEDPKKFIQQLSGKLGQSLRAYNDNNGQPDLELEKFAVNSLLSATHTSDMDEEDQNDIIKKVKTAGQGDDMEDNQNQNDGNQDDNQDGNQEDDMGDDMGGFDGSDEKNFNENLEMSEKSGIFEDNLKSIIMKEMVNLDKIVDETIGVGNDETKEAPVKTPTKTPTETPTTPSRRERTWSPRITPGQEPLVNPDPKANADG